MIGGWLTKHVHQGPRSSWTTNKLQLKNSMIPVLLDTTSLKSNFPLRYRNIPINSDQPSENTVLNYLAMRFK